MAGHDSRNVEDWIREWIDRLDPEQISEWDEIHSERSDDGCSAIGRWTPEHRKAVWISTREFVFRTSPLIGLSAVSKWSPRAGAWICAQLARRMLRYVSVQESPKRVIDVMEGWVLNGDPIDADEGAVLVRMIQDQGPFRADPLELHAQLCFFHVALALSLGGSFSGTACSFANEVMTVTRLSQMPKDRRNTKAVTLTAELGPEIIRSVNIEIAELIPAALDAAERGFAKTCGS